MSIRARRSFIFTPGLKPEMFPKALACGVDMVCVELEDGIAPHDKEEARKHALNLFKDDKGFENVERILRINSIRTQFGLEDLHAVLKSENPPPALMLPKVMDAEEIIIKKRTTIVICILSNLPIISVGFVKILSKS